MKKPVLNIEKYAALHRAVGAVIWEEDTQRTMSVFTDMEKIKRRKQELYEKLKKVYKECTD
jgi:hypothetical protein